MSVSKGSWLIVDKVFSSSKHFICHHPVREMSRLGAHLDNTFDLSTPIMSQHNDLGKTKLNEQEESLEEVKLP